MFDWRAFAVEALAASSVVHLEPCPAAVVAAGLAATALPATGAGDPASQMAAALVLLVLGGLAIALGRRPVAPTGR